MAEFFPRSADTPRTPKGTPLSDPALRAMQARLEADTYGKTAANREVAAIAMTAGLESSEVQAYIQQAVQLVTQYVDSLGNLRQVLPLLNELDTTIQADVTLSQTQRRRARKVLQQLHAFVLRKLTLDGKISTQLKNVARAKTSEWKSSIGEKMKGSGSFLLRAGGRILTRQPAPESGIGQDIANTRAETLRIFAANDAARRAASRVERVIQPLGTGPLQLDQEDRRPVKTTTASANEAAVGKNAAPIFKRILDVDKQIYTEVKAVKETLVAQKALDEAQEYLAERNRERAADNKKKTGFGSMAMALTSGKTTAAEAATNPGFLQRVLETGLGVELASLSPAIVSAVVGFLPGFLAVVAGGAAAYFGGQALGKAIRPLQESYAKDAVDPNASDAKVAIKSGILGALGMTIFGSSGAFLGAGLPDQPKKAPEKAPEAPISLTDKVSAAPGRVGSSTPGAMQLSSAGLEAIVQREGGYRTKAYEDVNGYAIGIGQHTFQGKPVKKGQTASVADLQKDAWEQLNGYYSDIVRTNLKRPVSQGEFDALVSVAWNLPSAAMKLVDKVNSGAPLVPSDFTISAKSKGKVDAGLVNRRLAEFTQFTDAPISAPSMTAPSPTAVRSGITIAQATTQMDISRAAGRPTVIMAPPSPGSMTQLQQTTYVPVPIRVDNPDSAIRAIREASGNPLR